MSGGTTARADAPDVLVIGGGLAGLSAAVRCLQEGRSVFLAERRPYLGGRARSFPHPESGDEVDNGQHLMMGCYHASFRYLRAIGTDHLVHVQERLSILFRHPDGTTDRLTASDLPAPFHILTGLFGLRRLTPGQRAALLRVGPALLGTDPERNERLRRMTVSQWLDRMGQPEENRRFLWDIIAVGALNDSTDRISAALFVKVLRSAFLGSRRNAAMAVPLRGLSAVLSDPAERLITEHGGTVLKGNGAERVEIDGGRVTAVTMQDGRRVTPRHVISAVPYFDLPKVFGDTAQLGVTGLDAFVSSPIVTVHLWFGRHFVDEPFAALIGSPLHWVFNRSVITGRGADGPMYLAIVVSGAHALTEMTNDDIVSLACRELRRFYPGAADAVPEHSLVVKEKRATFSPGPATAYGRPGPRTAVRNLFLAGDWTETRLPATIEGAIQSGHDAAGLVTK